MSDLTNALNSMRNLGKSHGRMPSNVETSTEDLKQSQESEQDTPVQEEALLNRNLDAARQVNTTVQNLAARQYECVKIIGQMQALDTINKYTGTGLTILMRQMKETKAYKGMQVPRPDGTFFTISSFEDFCEHMGTSYSKAAEDIQNLNTFGEQFMEAAQKMGLGYRDLRKLRNLPEEERLALTEGESSDPEVLKDLLEEISAKRFEDKKALENVKQDYEAQGEVLSKKDKALNEAKQELVKLKHIPPSEQAMIQGEKEQAALKELHASGLEMLGVFTRFSAKAQGLLQQEELSPAAHETLLALTGGLCKQMTDTLLSAGIDIDFRYLAYPMELGELELRGD